MPRYDFVCKRCGETFEKEQDEKDAPPLCPACGTDKVMRVTPGTTDTCSSWTGGG